MTPPGLMISILERPAVAEELQRSQAPAWLSGAVVLCIGKLGHGAQQDDPSPVAGVDLLLRLRSGARPLDRVPDEPRSGAVRGHGIGRICQNSCGGLP